MDVLVVARENDHVPATRTEQTDPVEARALIPGLPHGPQVGPLLARVSVSALVLAKGLDRAAARAAIGVTIQRAHPKGILLLGTDLGRELLGEGLPLAGGIREIHKVPIAALGQTKDVEPLLSELCQRANVPWAPPSSRAAPARVVLRAEGAEVQAARLIEKEQWKEAAEVLRAGEPLAARGTNMLGRALLSMGDRDGARHAFERTLAVDPGNAIAQRQMERLDAE